MKDSYAMDRGSRRPADDWLAMEPWRTALNDPESMASRRDADVIRRIRAGDRAAFLEFYDRYAPLLLSVATRVLGDRREAEDVLQDVCAQIWHKSAGYDAQLGSLSSWAVTLTRNKAIDRVRATTRRRRLAEEVALSSEQLEESPGASANDLLYGRERAQLIRAALDELSADQRQVIELAFFAGLSQSEIAVRLEQPLGTVKARIRRGMLKLREQLGNVL
jgi:RNA polymerase sigma-70 factor (ECF subfamily)